MNIEQVFAGFDKVESGSSGGSNYLPADFNGIVEITQVKCKQSETSSDIYYIVEFVVTESNLDNVKAGDGREWAWATKIPGFKNLGMRDVKRFIMSAAGLNPDDEEQTQSVGADVVTDSYAPEQALVGCKVRAKTRGKEGSKFVNTTWDLVN